MIKVEELCKGIQAGDSLAIAKAITFIESSLTEHRRFAEQILSHLPTQKKTTIRIGISGIPGVGKSTFIEKIGSWVLQNAPEKKIAILLVDPSSPLEGGSILADRVRMNELSAHKNVFIRPTPTQGSLGGLAKRSRETILILEAAGFDYVFVETAGVGQNEFHIASLVDLFVLMSMPSTGDEWQALKKGINELADIIIINKADGVLKDEAEKLKSIFTLAFSYHGTSDLPKILACSAVKGQEEMGKIWHEFLAFIEKQKKEKAFEKRRKKQNTFWFDEELFLRLKDEINTNPKLVNALASFREKASDKGAVSISLEVEKAAIFLLSKI